MTAVRPILCVGLVCLDIVNFCEKYPAEDEDIRASEQRWVAGGNAANSCTVLSLIGTACEFVGTLGHGVETDFAVSQLDKYGVCRSNCVYHPHYVLPTSCILLNTANGSRTIIHYRNLPELTVDQFSKLDLSKYCWIHFEGRCPEVYSKMILQVMAYNERRKKGRESKEEDKEVEERKEEEEEERPLKVSVELENPQRLGMEQFLPLADVLMVSKEFAQHRGYYKMEEAVMAFRKHAKKTAIIVCAWGDKGAAACNAHGKVYMCGASPPPRLVDTRGAGDTFNAGLLAQLARGESIETALQFACRLAGTKCGMFGFDGLASFRPSEGAHD